MLHVSQGSSDGNESEFIRQVLYGTNRYQKLTQVSPEMLCLFIELHPTGNARSNVSKVWTSHSCGQRLIFYHLVHRDFATDGNSHQRVQEVGDGAER